jgi:hypothetical protein
VFYEITTENDDLRGQFVFKTTGCHGKKTVKELGDVPPYT